MKALDEFADFCSTLVLPRSKLWPAGTRMRLEPFQRTMLRDYFGGVRELLVVIPKKNGKTSLLAALALHHLLKTEDADCVIVANSRDQAMKMFREARGFVRRTPGLAEKFVALHGYREIRRRDPEDPENPKSWVGLIAVRAADADKVDGWGGTLALVDEIHRGKSSDLYGVLYDGLGPRSGQLVGISTAAEAEDSPLGLMRQRAYELPGGVKRRGAHRYATNGSFSMHEWALDPHEDRDDMRVVKRANPASWQTEKYLRERHDSPSMTPWQWARFAAGVWGFGGEPAFDRETWDGRGPREQMGPIAEGRRVTLGFDGSRRRDSTALVACDLETGRLHLAGIWRRPADAGEDWEIPETEVDQVVEWAFGRWEVVLLYGDPPYWESALDRWAGRWGSDVVVRWWTNLIKKTALALLAFRTDMESGELTHDGSPDLAEAVGNAVRKPTNMTEGDDELWLIRKDSRNSPRKIDAAMAAMLAWTARGDAIARGLLDEPEHAVAAWQ